MASIFSYRKNPNFPERYISPKDLHLYMQENLGDYIKEIGRSTLGSPIYRLSFGSGPIKIAAWSQMHGNESTATLAMLDLLTFFEDHPSIKDRLFSAITLDFVMMLNPDGAAIWKRRNAIDVDINRDYLKESSVEVRILKKFLAEKKYDYALNLHDQRTVFSAEDDRPACLSFLAPSENEERCLTKTREKSMAVISGIFVHLRSFLPGMIGRYNDAFYPLSCGDNLMKLGIPTVLFEGGFYQGDYLREKTREYYTHALFYALRTMAILKGESLGYETYFSIPENKESHYDVIYRDVNLDKTWGCVVDIAIQFKEVFNEELAKIDLLPYVVEVGDLRYKKAWKEVNCKGRKFVSESGFPKLDAIQDFEVV